jgi:hypothetical protein
LLLLAEEGPSELVISSLAFSSPIYTYTFGTGTAAAAAAVHRPGVQERPEANDRSAQRLVFVVCLAPVVGSKVSGALRSAAATLLLLRVGLTR